MNTLRPVTFENVLDTTIVPSDAAIDFPHRDLTLLPYEVSSGGGRANVWGINHSGTERSVPLEEWPGLRVEGVLPANGLAKSPVVVSFHYYKSVSGSRSRLENSRRLALLDPVSPFAYGVLLPKTDKDPPTGHEGEQPTWYLRAHTLGRISVYEALIDLSELVEERLAAGGEPSSYSIARILGNPIGNPLDPAFREAMGIAEVSLPLNTRR